ncbi:MAG: two-component system histidine kinase PnpS [bacterium]
MRIKIHYKITFIVLSIIAVILSGIYLYLNHSLREHTYQRIRTHLLQDISLAGTFLERDFDKGLTSEGFDKIADTIGRDLNLRATIIALDGTVLGDSELNMKDLREIENHLYRPEVQEALQSKYGVKRRFSTTIKEDMLYVAATFGRKGPQGIIRLAIPLVEIEQISHQLKELLIISLLCAFLFSIVIGYFASLMVTNPLEKMSSTVQEIAKGNFSKRLSILTGDEIGDLARAFNNMSDQIRAKIDEITASKSRFEAVLMSMFDGVMVVDAKGEILLMNQPIKDILLLRDEPAGRKPIEIVRNIEIQKIVDSVLKLKKGLESCEVSILLQEEKTFLVQATPVIRECAAEGAVLVFHDITKLKRLEKVRQDFVANVSHELRTPVSCIKGYSETLLEGALDDKENAKDFLRIIYSESNRLSNLIDDILNLSHIESGGLTLDLKSCDIPSIINKVISGLKKQAEDKSIKIETYIPDGIPKIKADDARIAQVLLNLIDNAIKYSQAGSAVRVSVENKNEHIRIEVSDTGDGIPEKDLPRIFERFYRVDKARSRQLSGTGLGLSIVKHIVQAHHGEVSVESILDQGSAFSFTIPKT